MDVKNKQTKKRNKKQFLSKQTEINKTQKLKLRKKKLLLLLFLLLLIINSDNDNENLRTKYKNGR